jgi:uncharacterized protein (TIGR02246 family)
VHALKDLGSLIILIKKLITYQSGILQRIGYAAASGQQSHLDMRRQIEQLAATFSERYNKQDAGAIANMFTKDAVRVTSGNSAPSVGPQAIEKIFETQFESGYRHIELVVDQVSPFGTDAAIAVGSGRRDAKALSLRTLTPADTTWCAESLFR